MTLTDKYVYAVTKQLPESQRADIEAEIRGLIGDMIDQRGGYSEETELQVLKELGHPKALADKYLDKPHYLIGPELYGIYVSLLKVVIPIAIVAAVIGSAIDCFTAEKGIVDIITTIFAGILNAAATSFGWATIVFAVFERKNSSDFVKELKKDWDPRDLPNVEKPRKKIGRVGTLIGIGFLLAAVITFNKYYHLFGIYYSEGGSIRYVPVIDSGLFRSYLPYINGVFAVQFLLAAAKLVYDKWTYPIAAINLAVNICAMIVTLAILGNPALIDINALSKIPGLDLPFNLLEQIRLALRIIIPVSMAIDSFEGFRYAYKASKGL